MTLRAIEIWAKGADLAPRPLGRPRLSEERREYVYVAVAEEWHLQGIGAGERAILHAFGGMLERTLVREALRKLKADLRRRTRERLEQNRHHVEVNYRDTIWSQDAQELVRGVECERPKAAPAASIPGPESQDDPSGSILRLPIGSDPEDGSENAGIVQAEMIRDVASSMTLDATVGPPAIGEEILAQLKRTAAARGTLPLVLVTDNGPPYCWKPFNDWLKEQQVIHLFNEPHTPEHNPWVEHGHGEQQQEMMLGAWDAPPDVESLRDELEDACFTLDHCRLRATRGWKTAAQFDLALAPASGVISRAVFYEAACQAIARAVEGLDKARERRRAEREAIFAALQSFGLITRSRGGVPIPAPQSELIT